MLNNDAHECSSHNVLIVFVKKEFMTQSEGTGKQLVLKNSQCPNAMQHQNSLVCL